jgi:hypothetical protein
MSKRKRSTWKVNPHKLQQLQQLQNPIQKWGIVMAELKPGTASVGIRFNDELVTHFFLLHKTPEEATKVVASIAKGEITLQDIAAYDWYAITMKEKGQETAE